MGWPNFGWLGTLINSEILCILYLLLGQLIRERQGKVALVGHKTAPMPIHLYVLIAFGMGLVCLSPHKSRNNKFIQIL